jgi:hypothetical protein
MLQQHHSHSHVAPNEKANSTNPKKSDSSASQATQENSSPQTQSKVNVNEVIWNVSPATTAADADKAPVHRQLPADAASHNDQCEYVSVAATLVHSAVAEVAIEPPDAAANVAA